MSEAPPYSALTRERLEEAIKDISLRPGVGGKDFVIISGRSFGKSFGSAWRATTIDEREEPIPPQHVNAVKQILGHPFLQALKSLVPQLREDLLWIKYKMMSSSRGLDWEKELRQKMEERLFELLYDSSEEEIREFLTFTELQELSLQELQYSSPDESMVISRNGCPIFLINLKIQLPVPIEEPTPIVFETGKKSRRNKRVERLAQDPGSKEQIKNMMRYAHRRK